MKDSEISELYHNLLLVNAKMLLLSNDLITKLIHQITNRQLSDPLPFFLLASGYDMPAGYIKDQEALSKYINKSGDRWELNDEGVEIYNKLRACIQEHCSVLRFNGIDFDTLIDGVHSLNKFSSFWQAVLDKRF